MAWVDISDGELVSSVQAKINAAGAKAETAVQPDDLSEVATSGSYNDLGGKPVLGTAAEQPATAFEPANANLSKKNEAEVFEGHKTFTGYTETGAILTIASGVLDIPLDGKVYGVNVTEEITSITLSSVPTAPLCGSTVVYFLQDTTGYAVAIPLTWHWTDSVVTEVDTTANTKTRMLISTDPFGDIHADAEARGTP